VLAAFGPVDQTGCLNLAAGNGTIQLFYSDEHALTLGVRQIVDVLGGTTTNYPVTGMSGNPSHVSNPAVGTTALSGTQSGTDTNTCGPVGNVCGRPMWPVLYVTDTSETLTATGTFKGDWQSDDALTPGGFFNNPDDVFGTWKAAVKTVNGSTITVTPDSDPATNTTLGPGSDPIPAGVTNLGYLSEVRFSLANLRDRFGNPLQANHTYRFEFMVHDGDQNKTGGDSGENCVTGALPANFVPNLTPTPTPVPPTATPTSTPTPLPQANTSVSVACSPTTVAKNTSTTCTATVTNTSPGHPNDSPLGTSSFTASTTAVTGSPCTLVADTSSTSKCSVTFTPSKTGSQTIKASYTSSNTTKWLSAGNSTNFTVTVTP
jgi:hypothetical protein